jgi:hypothetical protein
MIAVVLSVKSVLAQQRNLTKVTLPIKVSLKEKKEKYAEIYTLNSSVYVEGYDGEELIIEPYVLPATNDLPIAAAGLKDVTQFTIKDNLKPKAETFITEFPEFFRINVGTDYKALRIKAPRDMHLKLSSTGSIPGNKISLTDLSGKLEVGGSMPFIEVSNITGPLSIHSNNITNTTIKIRDVKWDALTSTKDKFGFLLSSYTGTIDIAVPEQLKASFLLRSSYGEVYSNLGVKPKFPESNAQNYISGELNGGGTVVSVITEYGNIFLRKEK